MRNKGNVYIVITAFLWSLGGIFIKLIPLNPIAINGLRSLIALLFYCVYERSFKIKVDRYVILAGLCLVGTNTFYVMANKMTTAANAIVLQYTAPIFVLILQSLYYKKKPEKEKVCIILVAFLGMVLFFFDQMDAGMMLGNGIAILAGLCFSGVFFINSLEKANSNNASKFAFLTSFVISIPFYTGLEALTPISISALLALGVFQVGLAYVFFSKGIKLTSAVNSSLLSLIEAILNPIWVLIFIGEIPSFYAIIGSVVILSAIVCNILMDAKKER